MLTTVTSSRVSLQTQLWLKLTTVLITFVWIGFLIFLSITSVTTINGWFKIVNPNHNWEAASMKIYLIFLTCFILIASILLILISYQAKEVINFHEHLWITGFLTLLSCNFYWLFLVLKNSCGQLSSAKWQNCWQHGKLRFGIKRWVTKDYVLIALFVSLTIVCSFIEEVLLPHLPFGGGFAIKYIPLMAISFCTNFLAGWLCGFVTAFVSLLFIPASNIISPWSFLFDYFLPLTTPALVALLSNKIQKRTSIFTYLTYFCHCFLVLTIIYMWQVIGGYYIWVQIYPTAVWKGYQPLLYSFVYNFIHTFIFTYPLIQIIIPPVYRALVAINQ